MQRKERPDICSAGKDSIENIEDIQNAIKGIENNLSQMNKSLLTKMLKGFVDIAKVLVRQESGIFQEIINWCRLYSNMHISIDPKDTKLLDQFERTASAAISYIIAYLQYKAKEVVNYHYSLLEIIDSILQNLPPRILQFGFHLEPETIACLWKPIDLVGNFNVQLLTFKIFTTLVKYLEDDERNAVLNSHNLNRTNLFRDELNTIIQETTLMSIFEERCRELLNNYNSNLSESSKIYSFNCKNVSIGRKYDIYRILSCDKLWIDLNLSSKLLTFKGRCRLGNEFKAHDIDVYLKILDINLIKDTLCVNFDKSHSVTSPVNIFSDSRITVVKIHLSSNEVQRLNANRVLMSYVEKHHVDEATEDRALNNNNEDVFDKLRCEKPVNEVEKKPLNQISKRIKNCCKYLFDVTPSIERHTSNDYDPINITNDSPVSTKLTKNHIKQHPIRQLLAKKRSLSNAEEDYTPSNKQRKKNNKKCSSSAKSSGKRNQKNKKQTMETLKGTINAVSALVSNKTGLGVQHSPASRNVHCHSVRDEVQNQRNNISSLRISRADINHSNRLENNIHSTINNSDGLGLKTHLFKKPITTLNLQLRKKHTVTNECDYIAEDNISLQNENVLCLGSNKRTENLNFPDCEEFRITKYNREEFMGSLPNVSTPTKGRDETIIDLTLLTPIKHSEESMKKELAENQELFALPKYLSQSFPVTPASSTSIMAISDINESSCFIDSNNELENENEEFHLVNRILNDWKTDSDCDDNKDIEYLTMNRGQESNLETEMQNSNPVPNPDNTALITIPICKSEDFFEITKEYQLKMQRNIDPLRQHCLSKTSEIYKHKVSKIAESILTESQEQRKEIELFQEKFKSLLIQMERQCEMYKNRNKQYQKFQENVECQLNTFENDDLKTLTENEHNELRTQMSTTERNIRQQVWQTYMENYRKSILTEMKTIPNL